MRLRLLGLLFIGVMCLGFTSNVLAQEADEWFLAWTLEGQLLSYTPDGEATVLIPENVSNDAFRAWHMDDDSVLMSFENGDGQQVLYHVTQTSAAPISIADEDVDWMADSYRLELIADSASYAVLVAGSSRPSAPALLINLTDHTARLLAEEVPFLPISGAGFSEDGMYLRYLGKNDESEPWTLRELKLETGEERVFYTVEDDSYPVMSTDLYGEQWVYSRGNVSSMISRSGDVETTEVDSPEQRILRRFVGNYLVSFPILCETDCVLQWQEMPDGETQTFQLPEGEAGTYPTPLAQIGDSQLLVILNAETLWLLSADEAVNVGVWRAVSMVTPPDRIVSPDGRWLLTLDGTETDWPYRVIDLQSGETLAAGDPENEYRIVQVFYGTGGFIVSEDLLHFQYYRDSDGQLFDLGEPGGVYWHVLNDGDLLFNNNRDEEKPRGIYRYDPDTEEYTLLVEDGLSLWIEDPKP